MKRPGWWAAGSVILVAAIMAVARTGNTGDGVGSQRRLPDGSLLVLQAVTVTATNYSFAYEPGGYFTRRVARLLPKGLRAAWHLGPQGRMMMSGMHTTNLLVVTSHHGGKAHLSSSLVGAQVFDDQSDEISSVDGMMTTLPGTELRCWSFSMFPRRQPRLGVRLFGAGPDGGWTGMAEFNVPNPLYGNFPQWTPGPLPLTKHDGSLAISLEEFSTGLRETPAVAPGPSPHTSPRFEPRKTRARFSFNENGTTSKDWRIKTLSISDATGNEWSPNFGRAFLNPNWITNGTVEFCGRLWPGETAWKLRIVAVSSGGSDSNDVWEIPVALPKSEAMEELTNRWERVGVQVQLAVVASPAPGLPEDFRGVELRGAERIGAYALAWKTHSTAPGRSVELTGGWDQNGNDIRVFRQTDEETTNHVAYFRLTEGATIARFRLAITRKQTAEFIARPDFVK